MKSSMFDTLGKILDVCFFTLVVITSCFFLVIFTGGFKLPPQDGVKTERDSVSVKSTQILMSQYEKHCLEDSVFTYVCAPDTSTTIYTKHKMFSISAPVQKWVHFKPTYEGFKEYLLQFVDCHKSSKIKK